MGVDDEGRVGFHRHRSHDLEVVANCPIACAEIEASGALEAHWPGVAEIEVAVAPDRRQCVIGVVTLPKVRPTLPQLDAGMVVNARVTRQPGDLHTTVGRHTFRVSAGVFWQVHLGAAQALSAAVRGALGARRGDRVVDLYAGAGLFSVLAAHEVGPTGDVLAIERDRHACADAEHNGRQLPQLRVQRASVNPAVIATALKGADLVVLDPTREGAGQAAMAALGAHADSLRRVVYVSCDPSSFGRDARVLLDAGFSLGSLRAFDIFPMTEHVEMVATFDAPGP